MIYISVKSYICKHTKKTSQFVTPRFWWGSGKLCLVIFDVCLNDTHATLGVFVGHEFSLQKETFWFNWMF